MKIAILGPGLVGGSLMLALKRQRGVRVCVWGRRKEVVRKILAKKMAHEASTDIAAIAKDADMVVLCTPIGVMASMVKQLLPYLKSSAIVTDVGSVKSSVEKKIAPLLRGRARWVGSHPMAGSEEAGMDAAKADLFERAVVIVTPTPKTNSQALAEVKNFWRKLGGKVVVLSPQKHDKLIGEVSHLTHATAATLAMSVSRESLPLCGNGFRDTTRVAGGPAAMWAEILTENRIATLKSLDLFLKNADKIRRCLKSGKKEELKKLLARAAQTRNSIQ